MSRIYTLGFEINSTDDGVEFENIYDNASISPTTVRSGNYSGKISTLSSGVLQGFKTTTNQVNADTYYRVYVNFETLPTAENVFIGVNPNLVYVSIDNTGMLKLYDEDGRISGNTTISTGTWCRIELKILKNGGGSDVVELLVDGISVCSSSTRNLSVSPSTFYVGGNLKNETQTVGVWYFDDLSINDGGGDYQNGYAGAGSIEYCFPTKDEYAFDYGVVYIIDSDWVVGPTRETDVMSKHDVLNSNPPESLGYIGSTTTNDIEMQGVSGTNMGHLDIASVVQVSARWRNDVATSSGLSVAPVIRTTKSDTIGTTTTLNSTTWKTNSSSTGGSGMFPRVTKYRVCSPDIKYMNIGVKIINGTSSNYIEVSSLWAAVEYTARPTPPSFASGEFVMYINSGMWYPYT